MTIKTLIRSCLLFGTGWLLIALSGCGESADTIAETETKTRKIRQVTVSKVSALPPRGSVEYVGILSAHRKVKVSSEIGGTIENLLFEKGDKVKTDQLLAEINTSSILLDVRQAEAVVKVASSQLEKMETGTRPEQIHIAEAALKVAEAYHQEAEKNFKRMENLYKFNAVSHSQYDSAKKGVDAARAQMESAKQQLALAGEGPRIEDKKAARANFEHAKAALALARNRLKKSRLHAPANGIIAFRDVEPGEVISPGTTITQVVDLDRLKIKLSMNEKDIRILKKQRRFEFTLDAFPGEAFICELFFLSPTADPRTRSFPLEFLVDNPDPRMADGMTARVRFSLVNEKKTIKVPSAWLSEENGSIGLFVVNDKKALFMPVTLGAYYDQRVEILSGLKDNQWVITNPAGLKTGDPVQY